MKKRVIAFLMTAALLAAVLPVSSSADGPYYYADLAAGVYHVKWDCPEVQEDHWQTLSECTFDQLSEAPYSAMRRCDGCFSLVSRIPAGTRSFHYLSPYDTGDEGCSIQAGIFREGTDLSSGIYTAEGSSGCRGEVILEDRDRNPLRSYRMQEGTAITFYLGKHMTLHVPEGCTVRKLVYHPLFQDTRRRTEVRHARYATMLEIPGRLYNISNVPGKEGYCIISDVMAEVGAGSGQVTKIENGDTVQIDLRGKYDIFVEFIDCIVWPGENSAG